MIRVLPEEFIEITAVVFTGSMQMYFLPRLTGLAGETTGETLPRTVITVRQNIEIYPGHTEIPLAAIQQILKQQGYRSARCTFPGT